MIEPIGAVARLSGSVRQLIADSDIRSTQQGVLEFSPQFAKKKDLANRFIVAYAQAIDFYNENWKPGTKPTDELAKVLVDAGAVPSRAVLDESVPPLLQQYGEMDLGAAKSDYDYFKEQKTFEDPDIAFEAAIDTSFTDFAKAYLSKK
jgi:ABC-type nitrate/sulfonate/bicarbonate transport system substrate-binding protein